MVTITIKIFLWKWPNIIRKDKFFNFHELKKKIIIENQTGAIFLIYTPLPYELFSIIICWLHKSCVAV